MGRMLTAWETALNQLVSLSLTPTASLSGTTIPRDTGTEGAGRRSRKEEKNPHART